MLVAKEGEMEKRKVQEAVAEWQAEKRRRVEDGEEADGEEDDDEDVQDVQVRFFFLRIFKPPAFGCVRLPVRGCFTLFCDFSRAC